MNVYDDEWDNLEKNVDELMKDTSELEQDTEEWNLLHTILIAAVFFLVPFIIALLV